MPQGGNSWSAAGGTSSNGLHHPGVMRRGGRYGGNRSGPYDRRGGGWRYNNHNTGRLSPVRDSSRLPGNATFFPPGRPAAPTMFGRFPDAVSGGQQAMGPREAVRGRNIKSYEDLDNVGGEGGEELDY